MFQQFFAAIISGEIDVVSAQCANLFFFALRDPVSLKISIIGKYTASGFRFTECTVLLAGIHLYRDISSKNVSTVSLDIILHG